MRVWLWDVPIDVVDLRDAFRRVQTSIADNETVVVTTPNSEILYHSRGNSELRAALVAADLSVADGIGVVIALRLLGGVRAHRTPGVDLVQAVLRDCENIRVYLLGAQPDVVEQAAKRLCDQGVDVAGYHHGYFSSGKEERIVDDIVNSGATVLLVGMGSPRQEVWVYKWRKSFAGMCVMSVGGTIDLIAGRVRRAPMWCQRMGMEWVYRIITDLSRWQRGVILGRFGVRVMVDWLRGKRIVTGNKG